jgi:peptidoglycan/xylan/chitin deacetylase (PgdA/CDA1 family)
MQRSHNVGDKPGAFVISLDFELHWGVRDHVRPDSPYSKNLYGARLAIPQLLSLFEDRGIAATWATVGLLFASTREEAEKCSPSIRPHYHDVRLSPYEESVGEDEQHDKLHFAPSLIEQIRNTRLQEIGSHTYSHYYAMEPGQSEETFRNDLRSACEIAALHGVALRSLVFPRNQINPNYLKTVAESGFIAFRGNQPGHLYKPKAAAASWEQLNRGLRLLDSYGNLNGYGITRWDALRSCHGLVNIPASRFFRPYTPALEWAEPIRRRRIVAAMTRAAESSSIFHLWWHPHNFGGHLQENMAFLEIILSEFLTLREHLGMQSLNMSQVAEIAPVVDG